MEEGATTPAQDHRRARVKQVWRFEPLQLCRPSGLSVTKRHPSISFCRLSRSGRCGALRGTVQAQRTQFDKWARNPLPELDGLHRAETDRFPHSRSRTARVSVRFGKNRHPGDLNSLASPLRKGAICASADFLFTRRTLFRGGGSVTPPRADFGMGGTSISAGVSIFFSVLPAGSTNSCWPIHCVLGKESVSG